MRIPNEQLKFIKANVKKRLPETKIYIFGSRIDDNKRGGDIDILISSSQLLTFEQEVAIRIAFEKKFGEQKLDLVNFTFDNDATFKKLILLDAVEIWKEMIISKNFYYNCYKRILMH